MAGNFDNDFFPDIAVSYQIVETGRGDSDIYIRAMKATLDGFGVMGDQHRVDGSNGNNGWPITMRARDADRDGNDEVQLMVRNTLRSIHFDENMNQISRPSPVYASSLYSDRNAGYTSTFAATDMDLADSDTLKTEIALIDERGLVPENLCLHVWIAGLFPLQSMKRV
ncbi:MAG TPA: hypothetical protein VJ951_10680 [Bacteroidales bacterium]|nr:hypothetical protein [Bacteroidales bacterium]